MFYLTDGYIVTFPPKLVTLCLTWIKTGHNRILN